MKELVDWFLFFPCIKRQFWGTVVHRTCSNTSYVTQLALFLWSHGQFSNILFRIFFPFVPFSITLTALELWSQQCIASKLWIKICFLSTPDKDTNDSSIYSSNNQLLDRMKEKPQIQITKLKNSRPQLNKKCVKASEKKTCLGELCNK